MKKLLWIPLLFCALPMPAQVCKSGQYDMLDWMLPTRAVVNSHFDVLYPSTGTFYWVKGVSGFPWDVDDFDQTGIYQVDTELVWNDPHTFKQFEVPRKWMKRCITPGVAGQRLDQQLHDKSLTWYDTHSSCTSFIRQNLGYGLNELWDEGTVKFGTMPAAHTLALNWLYACNSSYAQCKEKEVFELQLGPGLTQWSHYKLQANGSYQLVNQTHDVNPQIGTIQPVHPCW